MSRVLSLIFSVTVLTAGLLSAATALAEPLGSPGVPHRWPPALKQAIGAAYEEQGAASPVWFTVAQGILTEVFYPTVDTAQVGDMEFIVTGGNYYFSEQKRDTNPRVSYLDEGMAVRIEGEDSAGRYSYQETLVTDPSSPVLRVHVDFKWNEPGLRLFVLFKPAIGNRGAGNFGSSSADALSATRTLHHPVVALVKASTPFRASSVGYVGFSDGWQDLSKNFKITETSSEAGPGNVALTGELRVADSVDLALAFGASESEARTYAVTALAVPFDKIRGAYEAGWQGYVQSLAKSGLRFITESTFARRSAELIKMHEDKLNRGAIVAGLSNPALPLESAPDGTGGYHLVWPRDLYHAAMGLLAAGDNRTPADVLDYLVRMQKPAGSWAQNFWVDGTPYYPNLQMDEVSFPILLAGQLHSRLGRTLAPPEIEMIRRAANFILAHGPKTQQDRWEEVGGYVPSTLASEIAALRVASALTGDTGLVTVADQWQTMIESRTFETERPDGGGNHYLRAAQGETATGSEPGPDTIDGGFLELVRLGIRSPTDPRITSSLAYYKESSHGASIADPSDPAALLFRRYNGDVYGPNSIGGFWPLLAGEYGHYSVSAGNLNEAQSELFVMEKSGNPAGLLPEQVLAPAGRPAAYQAGLGVACPLVWAHAEDILLHRSIEEGHPFDSPRLNSGPSPLSRP